MFRHLKTLIITTLVSLLLLACNKQETGPQCLSSPDLGCGNFCIRKSLGNDFEEALAALTEQEMSFQGVDTISVSTRKLTSVTDFNAKEVTFGFWSVTFSNASDSTNIRPLTDVVDAYGNYYLINGCGD